MANQFVVVELERWMIPALEHLGQELVELSSYTEPFDIAYSRNLALNLVNGTNKNFKVWIAWLNSNEQLEAVGLIMGSVSPMLFSPLLMAVEETVYVRKGTPLRAKIANALMQAFLHWALVERRAAFARAGETSGIEPRAVDAFMRRNGFVRNGTLYKKEHV